MALWTVAIMGTTPIGSPIIGAIGGYNARLGLAVGGVAALGAAVFGYYSMKKHLDINIVNSSNLEPIPDEEEVKIS